MVCVSCQRVSNIIITYIDHQVYILSTYGFSKDTFGFTRTETRYAGIDQIILFLISGDSIIEVATELKRRKAKRIFAAATFGLFTNGMEKFDKAYEGGIIDGILTTNLIYQTPNLLSKPYYINCDMSKYIALIIDTLNHDGSLSEILSPNERIQNVLQKYKNGETI